MSKTKDVMDMLEKQGVVVDVGHRDARVAQVLQRFPNSTEISWGWVPSSKQPKGGSGPVPMSAPGGGGSASLVIVVQPSEPEFDL